MLAAALALAGPAAAAVDLGAAATYGVLAATYSGIGASTVVTGDVGYGALVGIGPTVSGTVATGGADLQAGLDQATALTGLNARSCTTTFPTGAVDLAGATLTPGVYCGDNAMNLGGGGTVTLNGYGVYVFRAAGALNTSDGSHVVLTGGAVPSDVFWTPAGATTLGANSEFVGTVIGGTAITLGTTVSWTGQALQYGNVATLDSDLITVFLPMLSVSVVSATTYDFASVATGSIQVSTTAFDILNDGNVPELLALAVADPAPWVSTASGEPSAMNSFEIDAQFNGPGQPGSWAPGSHALTTVVTASTLTHFAGNEDATFVAVGEHRHLWVRFLAPLVTDQVGSRAMVITIVAQAP